MVIRTIFVSLILMFVLIQTGQGEGIEEIQRYFSDVALKVEATDDPNEKREILANSFESMMESLNRAKYSPLTPISDHEGIDKLKSMIQEYQDELAGVNGFERVPDGQLNNFSHYVVQNLEQARTITISLTTLLLIIIIIILLA